MLVKNYHKPHSSFLSIDKDLEQFVDMMLKDNNLKKLLYYTTKDCLSKDNLTDEQTYSLINKQIRIVPKILVDNEVLNYIIITFDNFTPNEKNPAFRDNIITFDIICHYDQWQLPDFQLRPYRIAAELDTMFNNKHFSGIGTLQFLGANQMLIDPEIGGISLMYAATHGGDDQVGTLNPTSEEQMIDDFNENPVRN